MQEQKTKRISVVTALTGEHVAELDLPQNKTIAALKLEVGQIMGAASCDLSILTHDFTPLKEFDHIGSVLDGDNVVVHVVVDEPFSLPGTCNAQALPFEGLERGYLPASGLVDSALGESVLSTRRRTMGFTA